MDEYEYLIETHYKLYEALTNCKTYSVDGRRPGLVVDGEKEFNQPGISHGFVHLKDKKTGKCICFCGIDYFLDNAEKV